MSIGRPRLAVTGIGMVTGLGSGTEPTLARLLSGESAIASGAGVFHRCSSIPWAAEVPSEDDTQGGIPKIDSSKVPASDRFAALAAREALDVAGLSSTPVELILGASTGATREGVAASVAREDKSILPLVSRLTTQPLGASGHRLAEMLGNVRCATVVCAACSSGALAIAIGAMRLEQGSARPQLVGGCDSLNLLTLSGFESIGALSTVPCRPFDQQHGGLSLGEGAGFLVLETEDMVARRNGHVLVWLDGYAVGAEAHHLTHPEAEGGRAAELVREAIQRAGLGPADIDYVNAHGTATIANDEMESRVLASVLGDGVKRVFVSSSKGQIGHTLAAAGSIEAGIAASAIIHRAVPPTVGLSQPAEACQLRHVKDKAVACECRTVLSNSFGFGGACAALLMRHRDEPSLRDSQTASSSPIYVTGLATLGERGLLRGKDNLGWLDGDCGSTRVELPFEPLDLLVMERSRRFDRLTAMTTLGCTTILSDSGRSAELGADGLTGRVGLVLGNSLGPVGRSAEFVQRILRRGAKGANPAEFPHLLPSAVSGNASIYAGLRGPVFNVSDVGPTIQSAMELGIACIRAGSTNAMAVGTTECRDEAIAWAQQQEMDIGAFPAQCNDGSAWLLLETEATAKARGTIGCELVVSDWLGELVAKEGGIAGHTSNSVVLWATDGEDEASEFLAGLGWSATVVRSCTPRAHDGWSHPGFVLVAGAALVCAGQFSSVLVVTASPRGRHCAVFRRVGQPEGVFMPGQGNA